MAKNGQIQSRNQTLTNPRISDQSPLLPNKHPSSRKQPTNSKIEKLDSPWGGETIIIDPRFLDSWFD